MAAAELPGNYFELYMLAVEMADRISAQRGLANSFFLTVNTGVLALLGTQNVRWYPAAAGIGIRVRDQPLRYRQVEARQAWGPQWPWWLAGTGFEPSPEAELRAHRNGIGLAGHADLGRRPGRPRRRWTALAG